MLNANAFAFFVGAAFRDGPRCIFPRFPFGRGADPIPDISSLTVFCICPEGSSGKTKFHRSSRDPHIIDKLVQGDTSGSSQPPVDIKTDVVFQYMRLILKRNFCLDVNRRLGTT